MLCNVITDCSPKFEPTSDIAITMWQAVYNYEKKHSVAGEHCPLRSLLRQLSNISEELSSDLFVGNF